MELSNDSNGASTVRYRRRFQGIRPTPSKCSDVGQLLVAYAGQTVPVVDPETDELRQA